MAKVRKKYNHVKHLANYNNYILSGELIGVINKHKKLLANIKNKTKITNDVICDLLMNTYLFEIIFIYNEDKKHFNDVIRPQFGKNIIIDTQCEIQEVIKMQEIIKKYIFKYQVEECYIEEIDIIHDITIYIIDFLTNLKDRVIYACLCLYARQKIKLFLLPYLNLLKYYQSEDDPDMWFCLMYRINHELILYKHYEKKQIAVCNNQSAKINFISKEEAISQGYRQHTKYQYIFVKDVL